MAIAAGSATGRSTLGDILGTFDLLSVFALCLIFLLGVAYVLGTFEEEGYARHKLLVATSSIPLLVPFFAIIVEQAWIYV